MFTPQPFTSILLAFLSFSVQAFPLFLRDVIAPPIIKPDASSIWPIGTQQMVIWDTSAIPPPSQVTNPIARIILGFNESDSLNLDFEHPLAKDFKLTDGNVTITVPDVPPRNNYLIVLYGDSGDTSSIFAITRISSPISATLSSPLSSDSIDGAKLPTTTSLSTSSSVTTPTSTDVTSTAVDTPAVLTPSGTTTTGTTSSSSASNSASALAASSSSAGWTLHRGSSLWNSAALFFMSVVPSVMVFMV